MFHSKQFSIAIIGAGPAGLCCAYELTKNKLGPILIIEKGCDIPQRNHKFSLSHYTEGIGGPGLYGDAKLCVYGRAGTKLIHFFPESVLHRLAHSVDKIFWKFDKKYTKKESPSKSKIERLKKICKTYGLELKMAYPIRHLGFKRGKVVVGNFVSWLKQNQVSIKTKIKALKSIKTKWGYKIIYKKKIQRKRAFNVNILLLR